MGLIEYTRCHPLCLFTMADPRDSVLQVSILYTIAKQKLIPYEGYVNTA